MTLAVPAATFVVPSTGVRPVAKDVVASGDFDRAGSESM